MAAVLLLTTLAGCLAGDDGEPATGPDAPIAAFAPSTVKVDGSTVAMEVPVPVFLIGFEEADAAALDKALGPMTLRSSGALAPTARYSVFTPDEAWQVDFDAFLPSAVMEGNGGLTGFGGAILDGNAIEAYLHQHLPLIQEVPAGVSSLVILDVGERGHAYHYAGDVGWREPVRAFGERTDLLIWDPYAAADPWAGEELPHHIPDASTGTMAAWVERATAIRALQMPIWPPTTLPCHAVTVLLAVRGTSVTPTALGLQSWDETIDVPRLQATFENLTQDPVHVDLVVLHLPQDDPGLEATTRENNGRILTAEYLDLNFDDYHVAHDGCEPYLSLVVYGDLADQRTTSNGNAQMALSGHRISTSLVAENVRVMTEVVGYNGVWDESTNFERVGPGAHPHEWFNWVVSHETGHLFSLPHPNYSTGDVSYSDTGFASTWNVMGYQMRRIVTEMSALDTNNFARNQAAYALLEAGGGASEEALEAMGEYRWKDVSKLLNDS